MVWILYAFLYFPHRLYRHLFFLRRTLFLGAATSWALDLNLSYKSQFWICWSLFAVCLLSLYTVIVDIESPSILTKYKNTSGITMVPIQITTEEHIDNSDGERDVVYEKNQLLQKRNLAKNEESLH